MTVLDQGKLERSGEISSSFDPNTSAGVMPIHGMKVIVPLNEISQQYLDKFTAPAPYRINGEVTLAWSRLDIRSKVLLNALIGHYLQEQDTSQAVLNYVSDGKYRSYNLSQPSEEQIAKVVSSFRERPRDAFAIFRRNLTAICMQSDVSQQVKERRLSDYYDAAVMLTLKLDQLAFQPKTGVSETTKASPPSYIPNGFLDLGRNQHEAAYLRNREKLLADKGELLAFAKPMLLAALLEDAESNGGSKVLDQKKELSFKIASWLVQHVNYDEHFNGEEPRTAPVADYLEAGRGVCRHYALAYQLLAQQMGLSTRLFKADFSFENLQDGTRPTRPGRHAANAIMLGSDWYVLDVTHSDSDGLVLYQLDRSFKKDRVFTMHPVDYRFDAGRDVAIKYSVKGDGFWKIRSLSFLES